MTEVTTLLTERLQVKLHTVPAKMCTWGQGRPMAFCFGLNHLWMHSNNTDHLMFKKLLINSE